VLNMLTYVEERPPVEQDQSEDQIINIQKVETTRKAKTTTWRRRKAAANEPDPDNMFSTAYGL